MRCPNKKINQNVDIKENEKNQINKNVDIKNNEKNQTATGCLVMQSYTNTRSSALPQLAAPGEHLGIDSHKYLPYFITFSPYL